MQTPKADSSGMRRENEQGPGVGADLFGLVAEEISAPAPLGTPDEQRRLLIAELRGLIERDDYEVDPGAVAEAIMDESGHFSFIDWRD